LDRFLPPASVKSPPRASDHSPPPPFSKIRLFPGEKSLLISFAIPPPLLRLLALFPTLEMMCDFFFFPSFFQTYPMPPEMVFKGPTFLDPIDLLFSSLFVVFSIPLGWKIIPNCSVTPPDSPLGDSSCFSFEDHGFSKAL